MRKTFGVLIGVLTLTVVLGAQAFAATAIDYANTFQPVKDEIFAAIPPLLAGVLIVLAVMLAVRLGFALYRRVAKA